MKDFSKKFTVLAKWFGVLWACIIFIQMTYVSIMTKDIKVLLIGCITVIICLILWFLLIKIVTKIRSKL